MARLSLYVHVAYMIFIGDYLYRGINGELNLKMLFYMLFFNEKGITKQLLISWNLSLNKLLSIIIVNETIMHVTKNLLNCFVIKYT